MEANLRTSCSSSSSSSSSEEEDYINMEVDSSRSIFHHSSSSAKEFEFQSFSSSSDRDNTTTSPADELFYMGKLLPLHLPPRLEMVHKILQNPPKTQQFYQEEEESFNTPMFTPTSNNTPFESCNVSPVESRQVSMELNPQEYFVEYLQACVQEKKGWTKKLRLIKQTKNFGSKLKSLFTKSSVGCSNEYSAHIAADHQILGVKQCSNAYSKTVKRSDDNLADDFRGGGGHRRSFSAAFKRISKAKTLPPPGAVDDSNRHALMKRSCSSSTELESPIQAAIAHCKSSHQQQQRLYTTTQNVDEIGFCSISAYDDHERSGICRI